MTEKAFTAENFLFDLDGTLTEPFDGITNAVVYALERLDRKSVV